MEKDALKQMTAAASAKVEDDALNQAFAEAKVKVEQEALKHAKTKAQEEEEEEDALKQTTSKPQEEQDALMPAKTKAWDEETVLATQKDEADEARELQEQESHMAAEAMPKRQAKDQQEANQEVEKAKAGAKNLLGVMAQHFTAKCPDSLAQARKRLAPFSAVTAI